ncbi:uncharacterized protein ISCGN_002567 [Ixodes scapularis]
MPTESHASDCHETLSPGSAAGYSERNPDRALSGCTIETPSDSAVLQVTFPDAMSTDFQPSDCHETLSPGSAAGYSENSMSTDFHASDCHETLSPGSAAGYSERNPDRALSGCTIETPSDSAVLQDAMSTDFHASDCHETLSPGSAAGYSERNPDRALSGCTIETPSDSAVLQDAMSTDFHASDCHETLSPGSAAGYSERNPDRALSGCTIETPSDSAVLQDAMSTDFHASDCHETLSPGSAAGYSEKNPDGAFSGCTVETSSNTATLEDPMVSRDIAANCLEQHHEETISELRRKLDLANKKYLKLSRELQNLKGLLRELLPAVECKVATMGPQERHCVLLMDEMQLTPGLEYDCTTKTVIGQTTLKGCKLPSNDGIATFATHGLVFMLAGLSTRWKQVIGYHFTGSSVSSDDLKKIVFEIIVECEKIGLVVEGIVSDMGACNQGLWKQCGVSATRHSDPIVSCPHPCAVEGENRDLLFFADAPHVLKNVQYFCQETSSRSTACQQMRVNEKKILNISIDKLTTMVLATYLGKPLPTCHGLAQKLVHMFLLVRLRYLSAETQPVCVQEAKRKMRESQRGNESSNR